MDDGEMDTLYVMSDERGSDSAAIGRVHATGRTRFVIYGDDDDDACFVDMTDEVVRQVQAALALALGSVN
jgi:K+/H+ antiporter YhaU regulatory subunit KhtT